MLRAMILPPKSRKVGGISFVFLVLTVGTCVAQSQKNLRSFSADELKTCLADSRICGIKDIYLISDELARRLPDIPLERLVECFDDWKICGVGEDRASGWPISDELARRGNPHELFVRFWGEPKWTIRGGIEHVAYHFHNAETVTFMRKVLSERLEDGEDLYWPVNFLAKIGDSTALEELSTGRFRNQGCLQ